MNERLEQLHEIMRRTRAELAKVIIGQEEVIDRAMIVIFTGQHALVEGVPGIAKTLLVRSFAYILGCPFARIQFTPDLMPADITGTHVFDMKSQGFSLVKGPVFTTFLLADEINRAPAKTQAALLQAMQERTVTIDRETYELSPHFTVFATQNPVEYEGTYPLPEAQKDRFMLKINMSYPARDQERELGRRSLGEDAPERVLERGDVRQVINENDMNDLQHTLRQITVHDEVIDYAVDLVRQTRDHESVMVGAGPRAAQGLLLAARAMAALDGRDFVTPDDIKGTANGVLEHRLILRPEYEMEGLTAEEVVRRISEEIAVPR